MVRLIAAALAMVLAGCSFLVDVDGLTGGMRDAGDGSPAPGCRDTTSDAANCGVCGHSCLGGVCRNSQCQPVTVAQNQPMPLGIFASGGSVYWANQGPGQASLDLADGKGTQTVSRASDCLQRPFDVAVAGSTLYWTDAASSTTFYRPLAGDGAVMSFSGGGFLAVAGTDVYGADPTSGTINNVSSDSALYTDPSLAISGFAAQGDALYWIQKSTDIIEQAAAEGGGTVNMALMTSAPAMGLALDADYAYWIESSQKVVRHRLLTLGPAETLYDAGKSFGQSDIAVDDAAIYWTETDAGLVLKLAKPPAAP